jgi:CPA1 family monovalent cation:H+ antiporter
VTSPKCAPQSPDGDQSKRQAILLSWVGIRGGISLAAALAIPPTLGNGSPFPQRAQVIIFTFAVILVTLVAQGLTLPRLLRWLQFTAEPGSKAEEIKARSAMAAAAMTYLQSLPESDQAESPTVAHLLDTYSQPVQRPAAEATPTDHSQTRDSGSIVSMELAIIKEQRAKLIELRDKAEISDEVLRRFQSILDLKESQLDQSRGSWEM